MVRIPVDPTALAVRDDDLSGEVLHFVVDRDLERGTWFDEPQRGGGVATVVGCSLDVRRVLGRARPGRGGR